MNKIFVDRFSFLLFLPLLLVFPGGRLEAKISFSGYADVRFRQELDKGLSSSLNVAPTQNKSEFLLPAFGMFAATTFDEKFSFLADITYSNVGVTAESILVQYAYMKYDFSENFNIKLGKVTSPVWYYNKNLFYSFQRQSINPPLFQSQIMGLPIADLGFSVERVFPTDICKIDLQLFAVNGYASQDNNPNQFRTPTSQGIVVKNNIRRNNNNHQLAPGISLDLKQLFGHDLELGAEYTRGTWDQGANKDYALSGIHLNAGYRRYHLLTEYFMVEVDGDNGMTSTFGVPDWRTRGWYVEPSIDIKSWDKKKIYAYSRFETSTSTGVGRNAKEQLIQKILGCGYTLNPFVTLKLEFGDLDYLVPLQLPGTTSITQTKIEVTSMTFGTSITF